MCRADPTVETIAEKTAENAVGNVADNTDGNVGKNVAKKQKRTASRPGTPAGGRPTGSILPAWLQTPGAGLRWLLIVGLLWLLLAMLYPGAMFHGEIHASADAVNADAFGTVGDASLADGHYPLWNPYLFAGMPTFGSAAYTRYLYPPSLVLTFLQIQLGFAPMTWLLAHLLFGGLGMAWLLSRWRLPLVLLILGAALWLLNPKVVAWAMHGHGSKLGAAMYLPWLVGWVWRVLDGRGARAVGMVGLLLGLLLLRGHPQITYYALLVCGWLVVFNAVWPLSEAAAEVSAATRWRRSGLVACGLGLGFLLAAVMLLPVYDYSEISIRGQDTAGGGGVGLDYATGWSLAPQELSTLVMPAAVGFGKATYLGRMPFNDYPNYFGVLWLALAATAWWRGRRALFIATVVMGVLAVLVALGGFGFGLYELLYTYLPFFNKFRIPSMILIVLAFGLALLAPLGVSAWRDGRYPAGRGLVLPAVLAIVGAVMLASGGLNLARDSYVTGLTNLAALDQRPAPQVLLDEAWLLQRASLIRLGLILLTAAAALWFSVRNERFRRGALPWVLLVLVAIDLLGVDRAITNPERHLQQVARDSQGRGVPGGRGQDQSQARHRPVAPRRTGGCGDQVRRRSRPYLAARPLRRRERLDDRRHPLPGRLPCGEAGELRADSPPPVQRTAGRTVGGLAGRQGRDHGTTLARGGPRHPGRTRYDSRLRSRTGRRPVALRQHCGPAARPSGRSVALRGRVAPKGRFDAVSGRSAGRPAGFPLRGPSGPDTGSFTRAVW